MADRKATAEERNAASRAKHGGTGPFGVGPNRPKFGEPRALDVAHIAPKDARIGRIVPREPFKEFTIVTDRWFNKGQLLRVGDGELVREGGRPMKVYEVSRPYWMREGIDLRDLTERELESLREHEARAAEPRWPGQVFRDRATGRELMREKTAALPLDVGTAVTVKGRRYTVAAVEGDDVLLDPA